LALPILGLCGQDLTKAHDPLARVAWSTSFISRVLFRAEVALDAAAIIPLGRPLPDASSSLPASLSRERASHSPWRRSCETPSPSSHMRPCSRWGLPCHLRCRRRGGLLPRRFTLACRAPVSRRRDRWSFSVALSFAFPRPGVTRQRALWSSDFPPAALRLPACARRLVHDRRSPERHRRAQGDTAARRSQRYGRAASARRSRTNASAVTKGTTIRP